MARRGISDAQGSVLIGVAAAIVLFGVWAGYQLWFRKD